MRRRQSLLGKFVFLLAVCNDVNSTNKDGKKCAKRNIPGEKFKHPGKRRDKGHRRDCISQKTQVNLGRARQ